MPTEHKVKQGECLSSIAEKYGLFPDTIWDDPANSALKQERKDPNVLMADDVLKIPDKLVKVESGAVEQRHRFVRKGTPAFLRLKILRSAQEEEEPPSEVAGEEPMEEVPLEVVEEDPTPQDSTAEEPWADAPYMLDIDGSVTHGQTDGDGKLKVPIPSGARKGRLTMEPGTERELVYILRLGFLDPITSIPGIAERLNNLGLHDGSRPVDMTTELREALRTFQKANGLKESGEPDKETQDKLLEVHGS